MTPRAAGYARAICRILPLLVIGNQVLLSISGECAVTYYDRRDVTCDDAAWELG